MNELLKVLDDIILDLGSVTDEQLQAKFELCKGGLIGSMMLDEQIILSDDDVIEIVLSKYSVSIDDMSYFYREYISRYNQYKIDDVFVEAADAANDEHYLMAA